MYYVGWVGCPHCEFRSRVCIEVEAPLAEERRILVYCPNDGSAHRFSVNRMTLAAECPEGLTPRKLEEFKEEEPPAAQPYRPYWPNGKPPTWFVLLLLAVGVVGTAAVLVVWRVYFPNVLG